MGSLVVKERPDDEAITFRDIISFCAQIMGSYAIINNLGQLEFRWYDFATLDSLRNDLYDGGSFDKNTPYATGDTADGGRFNPWDTGTVIDGGSFTEQGGYHHVYLLRSQSINTNDITITGISVTVKQGADDQEKTYLYGQEGYVLELSENLLIQEDNVQAVLQHVGQKITGNTFRPLNVSAQSDPSIEAGDLVIVTDRKQKSYWTVVTNTTFSLSGSQKIECSAETPTEKNYTRYGAVTKLISSSKDKTNQLINQQLSAYDIASRQLSSLMARSMGLYETYETQEDGSIIKYQHDKPKLSDSKTIWKQTQDAFAVSTDGGKTWNAGTDAEGNALFNVLSVIGFYFDWAKGGTLTLGGENNKNGQLFLYDYKNKLRGSLTGNDGLTMLYETDIYIGLLGKFTSKYSANIKLVGIYDIDLVDRLWSRYAFTIQHPPLDSEDPYNRNKQAWGTLSIAPAAGGEHDNIIDSTGFCDFIIRHRFGTDPLHHYSFLKLDRFKSTSGDTSQHVSLGVAIPKIENGNTYSTTTYGIYFNRDADTGKCTVEIDADVFRVSDYYPKNQISPLVFELGYFDQSLCLRAKVDKTTTSQANVYWGSGNSVAELKLVSSSSIRYKDVERNLIGEDVEKYYNINPVMAKYKDGYLEESDIRFGLYYPMFIAENVYEYFPEAVELNEDGEIEDWNVRVMIPAMFQMLKFQKEIIDNQQAEIESLTERIERLEAIFLKGDD